MFFLFILTRESFRIHMFSFFIKYHSSEIISQEKGEALEARGETISIFETNINQGS